MDRITLRPIRSLESTRTISTLLPPRARHLLMSHPSCSRRGVVPLFPPFIHTFADRAYRWNRGVVAEYPFTSGISTRISEVMMEFDWRPPQDSEIQPAE